MRYRIRAGRSSRAIRSFVSRPKSIGYTRQYSGTLHVSKPVLHVEPGSVRSLSFDIMSPWGTRVALVEVLPARFPHPWVWPLRPLATETYDELRAIARQLHAAECEPVCEADLS